MSANWLALHSRFCKQTNHSRKRRQRQRTIPGYVYLQVRAMGRIRCSFIFLIVLLLPLKLIDTAETPFWFCASSSLYAANSTFDHNLRRALASLAANASLTGFYNATVGKEPDQVIAAVQCRGDLDAEACQACVSASVTQVIQRCSKNRAALFAFQGCITYYRDSNFTIPRSFMNFSLPGPGAIPDPQRFRPILISFFNNLIVSATTKPSGRFFWGDKFHYTKDITVYGTAQCVPYLAPRDCKSCLDIAFIRMLKDVADKQGGAIFYNLACSVRYETYPFFTPSSHKIDPSSVNFITSNCSPPASSDIVGTPYHINLKALLHYLIDQAPISGFYSDTAGVGSNQAYGQVLCRSDVPVDVCWNCTAQAATKIQELCPNSRRAIIWLDRCQLRYSDVNFAGTVDVYDRACQPGLGDSPTPATFNQNLRILISNLTSLATQSSRNRFFATGLSVLSESEKIYAMVQCVRDIPTDRCSWCLQNASSDLEGCSNGKQGGRILTGSCNLAFGAQPFFFGDPTVKHCPPFPQSLNFLDLLHLYGISGKTKYKEASSVDVEGIKENEADCSLPQISLRAIQNATDNFSEENQLGEGGYGPVYKGKLPNGQEVAVKRLSVNSGQGLKEFRNEVELIAKLQHTNLVKLIGCCLEKGEKMLIYEYMPNGSLDALLKDAEGRKLLAWEKRSNIIMGIARGILYLHQDSRLNIIHRDLKAANVLLDDQLDPKISDFGMARIFSGVQGQAMTKYAMDGVFSTKSDVYSFGILLLEIISGQLNASFSASYQARSLVVHLHNSMISLTKTCLLTLINVVKQAWSLWCEQKGTEFIDPVLKHTSSATEIIRCLQIGLLCVQEEAASRPTMSTVVVMLGNNSVDLPLPGQPAFLQGNGVESSQKHSAEAMGKIACCFVFLAVLLLPLTLAEMAETPSWSCASNSTYTANSTFDQNLRRTLASLAANVSLTGFYNATVGKELDQVIAAAQCRGDLDAEACQACVSESATQVIPRCPSNRAALFSFPGCITYYRDTNFAIPQWLMNFSLPVLGAIPDPQRFRPILIPFFNNLIVSATTNPSGRFFWGDKFHYTKDITVYGIAQCVQYLAPLDCKSCLDNAFNRMLIDVADRQGGATFYNLECSVRYETYPFFTPSSHKIESRSVNFITSNCSPPASSDMVGTPYHINLKAPLYYLTDKAPITGFYSDTMGLGSNQVYGQVLCRGDIPVDVCWNCTAQAATKIQELCPNSRSAIIWLDRCQLRYSDVNFAGRVDVYDRACQTGLGDSSSPANFNQSLRIVISNLTSQATDSSSSRFFAAGVSVVGESEKIYAMAQCVRDIPVDRCKWCLDNAASDIEGCFNGKQGGRILTGSCNLAFGAQPFFFGDPTVVSLPQPNNENEDDCSLPQISLRTIENATDNFSEEFELGEGGYGPVYKGKLTNGQEVAVKRLSLTSRQGLKEFKNEVGLISKLQHRNLVKLSGCCLENGEKLLIYEYMPNGSLDALLKDAEGRIQLDWEKRFNIIIGIAKGILYLHQDSRLNIIHRDLKAANVLLDEQLNPKISDFGLARIFSGVHGQATTSVVVGTYGYMAPEYAMDGVFSIKSDVYSFGILLLEIISGQLNARFNATHQARSLVVHAWSLWCEQKGTEFIDPVLKHTSSTTEIIRCLQIGLLCIQEDAASRPTMSTVVLMLGNNPVVLPMPGQPAFLQRNGVDSTQELSAGMGGNAGEAMGRIPCCFVFLVVLLQPLKLAEMADAPFWYCASNSIYTANSTFDHNLRRALASLAANVSLAGFYNATVGKKPDQVLAAVLCRGDLDGEACQACVSESATQVIQRCPSNRGSFFVLRGCISYYRDTKFTIPQSFLNFSQSSPDAIPNPQRFRPMLISFFNNLIVSATTNHSGRFFWGDKFHYTEDITVYGTAQCLQYLAPRDCKSCLDNAFSRMLKDVADRQGGAVFYNLECSVRYETHPFFTPSSHKIESSSVNFITSFCSPPASSDMVGTPITYTSRLCSII
ncbi:G-type lectin S-receptor-like serine/threonine-protein kinase [Nymphaea thermarum]|nr:G-type lectin S-receptor-like serine/threonine-protein kinase [Nymphaea thermarum]